MKRAVLVSAFILVLSPSMAVAHCGSGDCGTGAFGTGGTASDGKAQGFRVERPSTLYDGETYSNVGNDDAGRISVTDTGTIQGTYRDGVSRGHTSGEFGSDSGRY